MSNVSQLFDLERYKIDILGYVCEYINFDNINILTHINGAFDFQKANFKSSMQDL